MPVQLCSVYPAEQQALDEQPAYSISISTASTFFLLPVLVHTLAFFCQKKKKKNEKTRRRWEIRLAHRRMQQTRRKKTSRSKNQLMYDDDDDDDVSMTSMAHLVQRGRDRERFREFSISLSVPVSLLSLRSSSVDDVSQCVDMKKQQQQQQQRRRRRRQ